MKNILLLLFIIIIFNIYIINGFINNIINVNNNKLLYQNKVLLHNNKVLLHQNKLILHQNNIKYCNGICNERMIYTNYLLGLRKTRKLFKNTTNVNTLSSILNYTNNFILNNSILNNNNDNDSTYYINNIDVGVKNIIMGNLILNVSNVKYIYLSTEKDKIIIELDKIKKDDVMKDVINNINNIDSFINAIVIFGKIMNIN